VLAVIAATIIQHFGDMRFAVTPSFVCAVMVSGWFGGMGPGLLSTALSILALKYYFVPPTGTFAIDTAYIPSITLFSLVALFVTWLSSRERKAAMSLVHAHDQLHFKIHELEKSNESLQAEIATRTRAEEELNQLYDDLQYREAKIRALVDCNIIGMFRSYADGRIVDANDAYLRIIGYDRGDLIAGRLNWRDLTPPEWRTADDRRVAQLEASGTAQPYEKEIFRKDGTRVPVLVGAAVFEGRSGEGVGFVLDLTDRKRAERAYTQVQMELAHANRVATMGQLSASIAHEISQPIGAALSYANAASHWLAAQPPNLEEVRRDLGFIVESGVRASEVIDRIRALVKKAPPRKNRLEINEAILQVIALAQNEMANNGISVRTQLAEALPAIQGDRVQLQQVILNLLINAIEAMSGMSEGPRELLISTAKTDSEGVLVAVRDSGPGLAPESVDRLFESFYTTKLGGLGMGLSICRSIIEAHHGRLWATANTPHGAIFQFTLPPYSSGEKEDR
jgi:PAS domain S-box-containing protein